MAGNKWLEINGWKLMAGNKWLEINGWEQIVEHKSLGTNTPAKSRKKFRFLDRNSESFNRFLGE
jgi:hypothetical protein